MDNHKKERIKTILICFLIGMVSSMILSSIGETIYEKNKKSKTVKIESDKKNVKVLWEETPKTFKNLHFLESDLPIKIIKIKIEENEYYLFINSLNQCHILPISMKELKNENKK